MTVDIFLPDLRGGGAERVMVTLSEEFDRRGHDVRFVLIDERGEYLDDVPDGVSLTSLDAPKCPGYHAMGALPSLIRHLRRKRPDAMLSALTRANLVAILAREVARVDTRLVVSERNDLSTRMSRGSDARMYVVPALVRLLYPRADAITAVSEGVADDLATTARLPRDDIDVVYNPSVTRQVLDGREQPVDHSWFEDTAPVVLGVGSLTEQKDFETLLGAFDLVRNDRQCKLVVLGEGPQREQLEGVVASLGLEEDVDLPGFVDNPFAYMARADVFVLSSAWEGLPNALIEAMACETPVVATDCPSGPREILCDGEYGPLVPVGDADAMADAIQQTLEDPISGDRLSERAAAFRPAPIAEQFLETLRDGE